MGKYQEKLMIVGSFDDESYRYIVAEALDDIVTRLDRMEGETKPRAKSQAELETSYHAEQDAESDEDVDDSWFCIECKTVGNLGSRCKNCLRKRY